MAQQTDLIANPFPNLLTQQTTVHPQDIPIPGDTGGGDFGGGPIGGAVTIVIDITASIENILKFLLPGITSAIGAALGGQLAGIQSSIDQLGGNIQNQIGTAVNDLENFTTSAFGAIGDAIGNAFNNFGGILHDLFVNIIGGIKDVLGTIASGIEALGTIIFSEFESLIDAIKQGGAQAIIPVLQLLVTATQDIRGVIAAIQTDIHGGVGALLQLPIQIASSIGGLEAAIQRATQQIVITGIPHIDSTVSLGPNAIPPEILGQIGNYFTEGITAPQLGSLFKTISIPLGACDVATILESLNEQLNISGPTPTWMNWVGQVIIKAIGIIAGSAASLEKVHEIEKDIANRNCTTGRLGPTDVIQAQMRGILDGVSFSEEMHANNLNDARAGVLRNLANQLLPVADLLDALFRGNTDAATFSSSLTALGYSQTQIAILQANAHTLPSLNDILRWKDYHATDIDGARTLLKALKYTDAFIDNLFNTYRTGQTVAQWLQTYGRSHFAPATAFFNSVKSPAPQEVLDAAEREQLTPDNANLAWMSHWALPGFQQAVQMFFRNLIDLQSVNSIMASENIPSEFQDALLQMERPLFQARQVTTYLANGIISEADAILELTQHGYDALHIKHLIDYAHIQKKASTATALTGIAALSTGTARTLFQDGAITEEQYISILVAHKVPPDIARLQADAEMMAFHAKQRKQQVETYVEEVLLNQISVDDALSQMQKAGFTQSEILGFQTKVRRQAKSTAKHPSVAEMRTFIKAGEITLEQFKNELELQGWGDPWLSAWIALETPPPATP